MAALKTKENDGQVADFLNSVEKEQKRNDSFELMHIMAEVTGMEPKMWGASIVGFGSYHYKYASGHEGDICMIGFSPRKQNISLYIAAGFAQREELLQKLGKHKTGAGCVYINKLDDVNKTVLTALISEAFAHIKENKGVH